MVTKIKCIISICPGNGNCASLLECAFINDFNCDNLNINGIDCNAELSCSNSIIDTNKIIRCFGHKSCMNSIIEFIDIDGYFEGYLSAQSTTIYATRELSTISNTDTFEYVFSGVASGYGMLV